MTLSNYFSSALPRGFTKRYCLGLLILICENILAEVTLDGPLDSVELLVGPNYQINANNGTQVGSNLFHSFGVFNINNEESVTFTDIGATAAIDNVMGRVTGGQPSQINGLIRSTISGANLFFINPAGVFFGPSASLDVQGAFHVSTADYIRLENGGKFDASLVSGDGLLTTERPQAFGFLGDKQPAGIHFEESTLILMPPNVNNFSISGGDISITENSNLVSVGGSLELISVSSGGEIKISRNNIDTSNFSEMGIINFGVTPISTTPSRPSQLVGNRLVIRGGQLLMKNTSIQNTNFADNSKEQSTIDIQMTDSLFMQGENSEIKMEGGGQTLYVNSEQLLLSEGAEIKSNNSNIVQGSHISISAKDIIIDDVHTSPSQIKRSIISAVGNADLTLNATNLQVMKGGSVRTQGGNISISAKNANIDGVKFGLRAEIFAASPTQGDSGNLSFVSDNLSIRNGARISTSTRARSIGNSGNLEIKAKQILVTGIGEGIESSINTETQGSSQNSGAGGKLHIQTEKLIVQDSALITARTRSPGRAGDIEIEGISIELHNQGKITSESIKENTGNAGTISINASDSLLLSGNSEITVATEKADAGNIEINADLLNLKEQSSITTSVAGGEGSGGNIKVKPKLLILSDASNIIANAQQGNAGNIDIQIKDGGALFRSFDSVIEASSQLGIDGNIEINAPDVDITSGFKPLPDTFLDVATILQKPCVRRFQENAIQFVNQKYQVLPDSPYALRTVSSKQFYETIRDHSTTNDVEVESPIEHQSHIADCM